MKHIFIYLAPAYFVYLLRNYCLQPSLRNIQNIFSIVNIKNTLTLGLLVIGVFVITYIPFYDHLGQVCFCYLYNTYIDKMYVFFRGESHKLFFVHKIFRFTII